MKGLLRKDWYMTVKYLWYMWGLTILFSAFILWTFNRIEEGQVPPFPVMIYPFMTGVLSAVSLIMNDEKEKWLGYVLTLPVTRALYVTEKYLYGACSAVVSAVICAVLLLGCRIKLSFVVFFTAGSLIIQAVLLPLMFRLGAMKGYLIFFAVLGGIIIAFFGYSIATDFAFIDALADGLPSPDPALCLLAALALYFLSWRLSILLYRKREL